MKSDAWDIVVLGGGVAGAAAAAFAARKGRRVALVTRASPGSAARWDWLHADACRLLGEVGIDAKKVCFGELERVVFRSADGTREAAVERPPPLHLVDCARLHEALQPAARKAGVAWHAGTTVTSTIVGEEHAEVCSDDGSLLRGRLLIVADGAGSPAARALGVRPPANLPQYAAAQWHARCSAPSRKRRDETSLAVYLATDGPLGFRYVLAHGGSLAAGLVEQGSADELRRRLAAFVETLRGAYALPAGATPRREDVLVRPMPRGAALDFETHVGKRALVIGDAGGFGSALSQDGIYPALRSAELAAEVAHAALGAKVEQDALANFDAAWRAELSDYIRLPGTDPRFLLPLVFSNAAVAARMGRAFFLGENV